MIDWETVYQAADRRVQSLLVLVRVGIVVLGSLLLGIGLVIYLLTGSNPWVLVISGVIAGLVVWVLFKQLGRDLQDDPLVLIGEVQAREAEIVGKPATQDAGQESEAQRTRYYLQLEVHEAFSLNVRGKQTARPDMQGHQRIRSVGPLNDRLSENELVTLACLPNGKAFARVEDLLRAPDDDPATSEQQPLAGDQ